VADRWWLGAALGVGAGDRVAIVADCGPPLPAHELSIVDGETWVRGALLLADHMRRHDVNVQPIIRPAVDDETTVEHLGTIGA